MDIHDHTPSVAAAPQSDAFVQLVTDDGREVYLRRTAIVAVSPDEKNPLRLRVQVAGDMTPFIFMFGDAQTANRALVLLINPPTP